MAVFGKGGETMGRAGARASLFEAIKAAGPTRADSVQRITLLAQILDSAFTVPGINRRVGFDALIGLIPGVGDIVSTALSSYIIWEARQLGLPRWKIARMVGNLALDTTLGAIPLAGDVFDLFYKANQRNLRIVLDHLEKHGGSGVIEGTATRVSERPLPPHGAHPAHGPYPSHGAHPSHGASPSQGPPHGPEAPSREAAR